MARKCLGHRGQLAPPDPHAARRPSLPPRALPAVLAGLVGGAFAYYHISYSPQHPFGPQWTFDALLITFIGGAGTLHGPVLGALFYVFLKEYLAIRWVDLHLLIFGALFIAIVLLLPGGLVEVFGRARRLFGARRGASPPLTASCGPCINGPGAGAP